MVARARFGIPSCGPGSEPRSFALQYAGALGTHDRGYSICDADAAREHARESAQLHHASVEDSSDSIFRGLGNHRCRRCEFAESFESIRACHGNGRFVVQTARFGANFADMRFLVLSLAIATAILVGAADTRKADDFRSKKAAAASPNSVTSTNDPLEAEYLKLLAMDDLAQKETDVWMKEAMEFQQKGAPADMAALNAKVVARLKPVKEAYEKFLKEHPKHAEARLAYASFLMDTQEEDEGV